MQWPVERRDFSLSLSLTFSLSLSFSHFFTHYHSLSKRECTLHCSKRGRGWEEDYFLSWWFSQKAFFLFVEDVIWYVDECLCLQTNAIKRWNQTFEGNLMFPSLPLLPSKKVFCNKERGRDKERERDTKREERDRESERLSKKSSGL